MERAIGPTRRLRRRSGEVYLFQSVSRLGRSSSAGCPQNPPDEAPMRRGRVQALSGKRRLGLGNPRRTILGAARAEGGPPFVLRSRDPASSRRSLPALRAVLGAPQQGSASATG